MWKPSARGLGLKGEEFPLSIDMLSIPQFLKGVGELVLRNHVQARWVADTCQFQVKPKESGFLMKCRQTPAVEECTSFAMSARVVPTFQHYNGYTRLDFTITDCLGNQRTLALFHDGRRNPWLDIKSGLYFSRIFMVSSDGVRVRIIYGGSRKFNVAILYGSNPDELYSIKWNPTDNTDVVSADEDICVTGYVKLVRILEQRMEQMGTAYDHARLGAEIAYTAASELLKLEGITLFEPSRGGKDLYSKDGRVVIQARMLVRTREFAPTPLKDELSRNLKNLLAKLEQDFRHNASAKFGLAVLTFLDHKGTLKLISYLKARGGRQLGVLNEVQRALNY